MTNKSPCCLLKLKNKNCHNIKRLPHSYYFLTKSILSVFIFMLHFFETTFMMKLNKLVTKDTDTVIFNPYHAKFLK